MGYRPCSMTKRPLTEKIPDYLLPYIVKQDVSFYTPIDHASWRYILKIAQRFFADHAHEKYLTGLRETGISTDRIPLIEEMDGCLKKFGWRAVAVSGFVPPAVFMEFLSLGILPIACDMRKLENLSYTPAPDIVHEAAGHAPIIADPEFEDYLRSYGKISEKAIYSQEDLDVYQAIRHLSEIKEDPASSEEEVLSAEDRFAQAVSKVSHVSEATQLARMAWWTIEYGLVGNPDHPKIYGAGLLSSVGESYHCLGPSVKKIPFNLQCIETTYDITKPQPQLFVAKDFPSLTGVLLEFAETMAYKRGGIAGLEKALLSKATTTSELDSGLQISGSLIHFHKDSQGVPSYLQFQGPTQLSFQGQEIRGQGPDYHKTGFGSPLGIVKGFGRPPSYLSDDELSKLGFHPGGPGSLPFESGILVEGRLKKVVRERGLAVILIFEECTVSLGTEILFHPSWGTFDMACGGSVTSVFGGAADRKSYLRATGGYHQEPSRQKTNLTAENRELNTLYARVRKLRDVGTKGDELSRLLAEIHSELEKKHPSDWLLRYELLELNAQEALHAPWEKLARERLAAVSRLGKDKEEMISRGLALL